MKTETLAKLAVTLSGITWGLIWLPLRGLNAAGFDKTWAFVFFNLAPLVLVIPLLIARWKQMRTGGGSLLLIGLALGTTQFFYSMSVLHTEIVRAMVLFYLNPVWSMLMARVFLKEAITPIRWIAIAVAFLGMTIILHADQGLPWPRNAGDWCAIVAGFAWSSSVVLMRYHRQQGPVEMFVQNFLWTGLLLFPFIAVADFSTMPPLALALAQLWWLLPFIACVAMVGVFASMWAVPKLPPAVVGILYMTEISAGAISSAIWSGEPFGAREVLGICLITIAAILESARDMWREQRKVQA
jgi:drug/metabolite transporter (DMT)-like permease